jgi:hypothetical protein
VTDGLFRETVRGVPSLPDVGGRFDGVTIAEQLVDSAVYRWVAHDLFIIDVHKVVIAGYSGNPSKLQVED